jgi:hypothetical protein
MGKKQEKNDLREEVEMVEHQETLQQLETRFQMKTEQGLSDAEVAKVNTNFCRDF